MIRLLAERSGKPIEFERLRILDMFVLFPPLLHRTKMPMEMREHFKQLAIVKPDDLFESVPSNAAIFRDLRAFQRVAVSYLAAREIIEQGSLKRGAIIYNAAAVPIELSEGIATRNEDQAAFIHFLVGEFGNLPLGGSEGLFKRSALPGEHVLT
jgi:hypothetical protein